MRNIILLSILAALFVPIPGAGQDGAYNTLSGMYYCENEYACLHERAHFIDGQNGWISAGWEYEFVLQTYIFVEISGGDLDRETLATRIVKLTGEPMTEIYAHVYAMSGGNVPETLARFYPPPPKFRSIPFLKGRLYYAVHDPGH